MLEGGGESSDFFRVSKISSRLAPCGEAGLPRVNVNWSEMSSPLLRTRYPRSAETQLAAPKSVVTTIEPQRAAWVSVSQR